MTCEASRDLIAQLGAGRLGRDETAELRAHIQTGCASCGEWLADTQQVALALSLGCQIRAVAGTAGRRQQSGQSDNERPVFHA